MEYYSALQRSETLTQATMWMNPENTRLRERHQSGEATHPVTQTKTEQGLMVA